MAGADVLAACPYLVSVDGPWHAAAPSRAHRCRLLAQGRPTLERQRAHCLGPAHTACPTWLEAHGPQGRPAAPGPFVPTAPVVLEGPGIGLSAGRSARRLVAPVTILVVAIALGALVLSRGPLAPGTSGAGDDAATASPTTSAAASTTPRASAVPATPAPTPVPTAAPTARPTATPTLRPTATPRPRTYTVKAGDNLYSIAAAFGTTVKELAALNDIANPSLIRVGQVLILP
jgi:LysM repeat protein